MSVSHDSAGAVQVKVRLPRALHRRLAGAAAVHGTSLNREIADHLERAVLTDHAGADRARLSGALGGATADPAVWVAAFAPDKPKGSHTTAERCRDFRIVFLDGGASEEQVRRVLWQVLEWAHIWRPVVQPGDPYMTHFRDGERNLGLRILATVHAEPEAAPTEAEADQPKE